ncbi:MAG: AAA family ATPase, partial [Gammaproteobacteria bacterium]
GHESRQKTLHHIQRDGGVGIHGRNAQIRILPERPSERLVAIITLQRQMICQREQVALDGALGDFHVFLVTQVLLKLLGGDLPGRSWNPPEHQDLSQRGFSHKSPRTYSVGCWQLNRFPGHCQQPGREHTMTLSLIPDTLRHNDNYIAIWCLRALLDLKLLERFSRNRHGTPALDDNLIEFLGLEGINDDSPLKQVRKILSQRLKSLPHTDPTQSILGANVRLLKQRLQLSDTEADVLLLAIASQTHPVLDELMDSIGKIDFHRLVFLVSGLLQRPIKDVSAALGHGSQLAHSGILRLECPRYGNQFSSWFSFIEGLEIKLLQEGQTAENILAPYIATASPAKFGPRDFSHIAAHYQDIRQYLKGVRQQHAKGANVLVYGPPGTGKTEMVKTLAAELGVSLHEIGIFLADGDPIDPMGRLRSYRWAQHMLADTPDSLLLFDEIEDVFPKGGIFFAAAKHAGKGWINRMLEENPVPTFWLSNEIGQLDPAMIRRFDLVVEIKAPNAKTRQRLLQDAVSDLKVTPRWVQDIARNENLAPAHLERAARVARLSGATGDKAETSMSAQIESSQKAMGLREQIPDYHSETPYDPALSNTNQDIERIVTALAKSGEGRLCLYGPPGTGKTGFAYYLGLKLGKPVIAKPASQLLGMFVGESEKNIARAFSEATENSAILLLDEADSLIHDRAGHQRSWETTQVNELLMQLERFRGIVIASTNLLEKVDSAAMRRFDFKIHFDYLKPDQAEAMFIKLLRQHRYRKPLTEAQQKRLRTIAPLTPACFAVAARQARIYGEKLTADTLLETLTEESAMLDRDASRPIGFVH